jgi:hypothetical protein
MSYEFYITPNEYAQAAANGIAALVLERRIRLLGWKKQRALHQPVRVKRKLKVWAKIAEENGIKYSTFCNRVLREGWEFERAATQPLLDQTANAKRASEAWRKIPKEYTELAKQNGIPYGTFYHRVKKLHWDFEQAATFPSMTYEECGRRNSQKGR